MGNNLKTLKDFEDSIKSDNRQHITSVSVDECDVVTYNELSVECNFGKLALINDLRDAAREWIKHNEKIPQSLDYDAKVAKIIQYTILNDWIKHFFNIGDSDE